MMSPTTPIQSPYFTLEQVADGEAINSSNSLAPIPDILNP